MPNHSMIYQTQAEQYEELIARQGSLYDVIDSIRPVEGLDVIDLGAGTGRLSGVLAPKAKSLFALDESEAMLAVTAGKLLHAGLQNWRIQAADHRKLPAADQCADLVVSGWSICYLTNTDEENWRENLRRIIAEIRRVLRPGGTAIIVENYGTCSETPNPPDFLLPYFTSLENDYGFAHRWIRTDYTFRSLDEAERLTRFFFGDKLAERVRREQRVIVPECAGVWWLHL